MKANLFSILTYLVAFCIVAALLWHVPTPLWVKVAILVIMRVYGDVLLWGKAGFDDDGY